jgi:hypothetical protein
MTFDTPPIGQKNKSSSRKIPQGQAPSANAGGEYNGMSILQNTGKI